MSIDCGKVNKYNQAILEYGKYKTTFESAPWYVTIFELHDDGYSFKSAGSIITPNLIISDAVSFVEISFKTKTKNIQIHNELYEIGAGIHSINNSYFSYTQRIKVEMIYLPEDFNFFDAGLQNDDISVLVLANKVLFINGITPVCIDWNSKYNTQDGAQGRISVFEDSNHGIEKPAILKKFFPYINHSTCRELYIDEMHLAYDTFCAGSELGPELIRNENTAGAGISFLHSNSYFLTGVFTLEDTKSNYTISGFTDIKYHVQWIRGILNKHITVNSCVLPIAEGVVYSYEGSNDILSHGTLINRHQNVIENCELGYHKAYPNSFRFCLGKGKWVSNTEKLCYKMCPPLKSDTLDIKCSHNGKYANCSNVSVLGTIATPSCKSTYSAPNGQQGTPLELHCLSNGMWNKQLYRCNPYCGRVYIKNKVLINNGEQALIGTAPWNIGIYRLHDKNHKLICGGSIIAPNLVISAAHCFWQKGMSSLRISINDGLYKIAVAKYDRNFTVIDNDYTQIINVEMIYLSEGYYGPTGFHAEDIAVIVLRNRISFSNGVSPVCLDWDGKYNVVNGNRGKVVGWGKTEKGIPSPMLLESSLPYIDHNSCRDLYENGFKPFVTFDKFCAGSALVSGQGVDIGDSGAGLSFLHSDSYYLTGVVSVKDPETNNSIATFTDVKYHIQWIRGLYNQHNEV